MYVSHKGSSMKFIWCLNFLPIIDKMEIHHETWVILGVKVKVPVFFLNLVLWLSGYKTFVITTELNNCWLFEISNLDKQYCLQACMSKKNTSIVCILIFMKIANFLHKWMEHEKSLMTSEPVPRKSQYVDDWKKGILTKISTYPYFKSADRGCSRWKKNG